MATEREHFIGLLFHLFCPFNENRFSFDVIDSFETAHQEYATSSRLIPAINATLSFITERVFAFQQVRVCGRLVIKRVQCSVLVRQCFVPPDDTMALWCLPPPMGRLG